ncbi:MAG TPA: rhomboid family intramembrane serine protease [Micromonosporaceae bacterium]
MTYPDESARFGSPAFYAAVGRAFVVMCAVVPVLALLVLANMRTNGALNLRLGIRPHQLSGLDGILFAPFLHNGWDHLLANSSPIIILGTFALAAGTRRFLIATWLIIVVSGLGVWFLTPPNYLVLGASGVAFGWLGLLFMRGLVERSWWHLAVALVAGLLYGWQLTLLVPRDESISWQGHLFGFLGGVLAAILTRRSSARTLAPAPSEARD